MLFLQFYVDTNDGMKNYVNITVIYYDAVPAVNLNYNENGTAVTLTCSKYVPCACLNYKFKKTDNKPFFIKDLKDFMENHYLPISSTSDMLAVKIFYKIDWIFLIISGLQLIGWSIILLVGISF